MITDNYKVIDLFVKIETDILRDINNNKKRKCQWDVILENTKSTQQTEMFFFLLAEIFEGTHLCENLC